MDDLHMLDYLDERLSLPALPGRTTFTVWITWMDNLHRLNYLHGRPSLLGLRASDILAELVTW
eukprot:4802088-Karenia_brevis.AAC.1